METVFLILYSMITVAAVFAFRSLSLYSIHMFQLSSYKRRDYKKWLSENMPRQNIIPTTTGFSFVCMFFTILYRNYVYTRSFTVMCAVIAVVAAVFAFFLADGIAGGYRFIEKAGAKKPLVMTQRAKRLLITHIIFTFIIPVLLFFLSFFLLRDLLAALAVLSCSLLLLTALTPYTIMFSAILISPVEKAVGNSFIRDAKKKLASIREKGLIVIGITGSYGKTSVKFFLRDLLSVKYPVCATPSSFNTPMGVVRTIRENMKGSDRIFICEMGARNVGDIKELCDMVEPDHGVITAIGPQHLETFGDINNIKKTKFELYDSVRKKGGMVFLNGDDENIKDEETSRDSYENIMWYSTLEELSVNGFTASDIKADQSGTSFSVTTPSGEKATFAMQLIGGYNVINVLSAISVASYLGIELSDLIVPVRRLRPAEHRMCLRPGGENVTIVDDAYNSNPVGSKAAVMTMALFKDGEKIVVTPGMVELGEKQEEYNEAFGRYMAEFHMDYIILVSGTKGLGEKNTDAIKKGALSEGFAEERIFVFNDVKEAIEHAYSGIRTKRHKFILIENDLPENY
ncbi:MAG: UDP-N-acetylmuramoyl-tripeptide--D-alanyl-D-alanine ligase [Lachnospiraceae bacterium]|nr:UDP-N-acetylmuramoyl-tripeptide--D-alanyl-D-alanine ligase [Lachnospiraceae bacterium]